MFSQGHLWLSNKSPQIYPLKTVPVKNLTVLEVKSRGVLGWVFCLGSRKAGNKVLAGLGSYLGLGVLFRAHSVLSRIQFLASVGQRSLCSCWLSAGDHAWPLGVAPGSFPHTPSNFKPAMLHHPFHASNLTSATSQRKLSAFQGLM